ncbi:dnaJ homolog subfamily C member 12 isoform X2 [Podarcis raffonei]|uniref:dnaJ homolog subfamily C member 12 isoform X2 n=1 Tax=Podarcis raffonei TaxID=65483 RepID=UPI002329483C|nr:dnaJ homolog subfamily C member 12 isoform X2 [Podarcis raffonei]
MDAILNCRLEDMEDFYSLLGCDELSTVEQILAEFKVRALECHPDKHPGNPQAVENFQKLQQAKEILTNEESRSRYDYWRRSKITIPFQQWEALSNSVKTKSENNNHELLDDQKGLEDFDPTTGKLLSPKSPDSPGFSDPNCWHLRFRWSGDTPSELLRKFRNYEI